MSTGLSILLIGCALSTIATFLIFALVSRTSGKYAALPYLIALLALLGCLFASFKVAWKFDPGWTAKLRTDTSGHYCSHCNAPVETLFSYCPYCGNEVE